jgi:hypothetical protein
LCAGIASSFIYAERLKVEEYLVCVRQDARLLIYPRKERFIEFLLCAGFDSGSFRLKRWSHSPFKKGN